MSDNSFGESIRRRRCELGFTQAELAEKVGVSVGMVSHWERGTRNPKEENCKKLKEALPPLGVLSPLPPDAAAADAGNPETIEGAWERINTSILQRRGQSRFRKRLLEAYGGKCAITACAVQDVLEAAHIHPYADKGTNCESNGLLLRADIHTLFDCGLITIHPDSFKVVVKKELRGSSYENYHDEPLCEPKNEAQKPNKRALKKRFDFFGF